MRPALPSLAALALLASCAKPEATPAPPADDPAAHAAFGAYVAAINSNNLDSLMAVLTDDVVYLAPGSPIVSGRAAVRAWAEPYLAAYTIHWDKTSMEFVVNGEWAYEVYSYVENDLPKGGGPALQDTGKGLVIYRRGADGVWRVARDAWNSDLPAPAPAN